MTIKPHIRKLLSSKTFIALVVIFALGATVHDMFYKYFYRDEVFMALNVRHYQDSPMAPLTFYIGHLVTDIFGDTLIALRWLKSILYFLTIGFGCIFFYRVTGKGKAAWYLFALFSLTSCIAAMDIYNWDTGSYPFMVLSLISALAYNNHRDLKHSLIMGICCGLMTASRVTNVAALPFLILLIFLSRDRLSSKFRDTAAYLIAFAVTLGVILLVIYGSPHRVLTAWSEDNIITGHGSDIASILRIIDGIDGLTLLLSLAWMLSTVCLLFGIIALRIHRYRLVGVVLMALATCLYTRAFNHFDWSIHMCLWQLPAFIFLFMPQISCMFGHHPHDKTIRITLTQWILLLFMLLPGVGSDNFYERIAPMVFMPLLLAYDYKRHRRFIIASCAFMGCAIMTLAFYKTVGPHISPRTHLASISPRLNHIYYKTAEASDFENHKHIYDQLTDRGFNPTYIGTDRYTYLYLFAPDNLYSLQHFHYISFANEKKYLKNLRNFDAIIVNDPVYEGTDSIAFRSYLHTLGFKDSSPTFAPLPSTTRIYLR